MISRLEALFYRCLKYIDQPLEPFHVLVGPNASGKSAFLDIIALLGDFLRYGLDEAILLRADSTNSHGRATIIDELVFNQESDSFELVVELKIPSTLRMKNTEGGYEIARYEVTIGKISDTSELAILNETLWLCLESKLRKPLQIVPRQMTIFPVEPKMPDTLMRAPGRKRSPAGWRKIVNKSERVNDYFQSETSGWNNIFRVGPRRAALANLPEDEERFPVAMWVRNFLMEGVRTLSLNSTAMRRPCSPSLPRTFKVDGSNLPLVVKDLQNGHKGLLNDWVEYVRTVLPDLMSIDVVERPEDRHLFLTVQFSSGARVPSWLLSDGTLRVLALTLLAYLSQNEGAYLIEEPENGVHPQAIEAIFHSLSSVYNGQVLLATHSPLIVGLAKPEQILCFAKTPFGATSIVSGDNHPRLRDYRGQMDLGTLYASGVLG